MPLDLFRRCEPLGFSVDVQPKSRDGDRLSEVMVKPLLEVAGQGFSDAIDGKVGAVEALASDLDNCQAHIVDDDVRRELTNPGAVPGFIDQGGVMHWNVRGFAQSFYVRSCSQDFERRFFLRHTHSPLLQRVFCNIIDYHRI